MKFKYLLALAILSLSLISCRLYGVRGSGVLETETRDVDEFDLVDISGSYEVDIKMGDKASLTIEAEDNLLPLIRTRVRNGKLIIDTQKSISPREDIIIKITTPELNGIETSGACSIYAEGIDTDKFNLDFSGAGSVHLEGNTDRFKADISGAGFLDAKRLRANEVDIDVSGATSSKVYARKFLRADCSGASSIEYYGDPEDVSTDVSGASSISRK